MQQVMDYVAKVAINNYVENASPKKCVTAGALPVADGVKGYIDTGTLKV